MKNVLILVVMLVLLNVVLHGFSDEQAKSPNTYRHSDAISSSN